MGDNHHPERAVSSKGWPMYIDVQGKLKSHPLASTPSHASFAMEKLFLLDPIGGGCFLRGDGFCCLYVGGL